MNDNELERRLRSETGPREEGYVPAQLPATLEGARPSGPSRLTRMAVLIPAVAAGVGVVAVAGALLSGTGPGPILSGPSPTPVSSTPPPLEPCQPADVAFYADPWGGAAGSRGTVVTISLAEGRYPCVFGPLTSARIEMSGGPTLIDGQSDVQDVLVTLEAGSQWEVAVLWSNWCGEPADALQLAWYPTAPTSPWRSQPESVPCLHATARTLRAC
jgi:hypothetical protein